MNPRKEETAENSQKKSKHYPSWWDGNNNNEKGEKSKDAEKSVPVASFLNR